MNPLEAGKLLAHCAAFDNRKPSKAANHAWAEALANVPADPDAYAAVSRFYAQPTTGGDLDGTRWIQPHHVQQIRRQIRDERIPDGAFTYPPPAGDETGNEFLQRRRAQIKAIADGRIPAEPIRELEGGPHPSIAGALAQIGAMPNHIRQELAQAGIGRRRGMWPELAIPCPLEPCRAAAWRECRTPKGRRMMQGTHHSRQEAWTNTQRSTA